jgi:hypothetical protein
MSEMTGKVMWTPETGWTDDGPTIVRRELSESETADWLAGYVSGPIVETEHGAEVTS